MTSQQPVPAEVPATPGETLLPTMVQRFFALLADWVLCLFIANGAMKLGFLPFHEFAWTSVVLVVEYTFFLWLYGQTPGMRLFKVCCVSYSDGRRLGLLQAVIRAVLLALVLPIITAFFDKDRRGLHDVFAGSIMCAR